MSTINQRALIDELQSDPLGRGYDAMTPQEVADSLNAENRTRQTFTFTSAELFNAIDVSEYGALSDGEKEALNILLGVSGVIDAGENTNARQVIVDAFGSGSTTVANLLAAAEETVSRADEIGLPTIRAYHVIRARERIAS